MNDFKVGFSKSTVNPKLGIGIDGYYVPRFAKGILDDLETSALVLESSGVKIALITVDNLGIDYDLIKEISERIGKETAVDKNSVFISASHSHTAPLTTHSKFFAADSKPAFEYREFLIEKITDTVKKAVANLQNSKMAYIVGHAPDKVAYIRRYMMKDGTTLTCPPINDPNIDYPLGTLDQRVNVIRFDREADSPVILVNYGLHADTVNGELISADWPAWMRKTLKSALDGAECMFFNGAEGDVGSTNVHPKDGDMNDTEISFDNEMKSPGRARFVGRAIAGTVLQIFDVFCFVEYL